METMDDITASLINEARALQRGFNAEKKRWEGIQNSIIPEISNDVVPTPQRYCASFQFQPQSAANQLNRVSKAVVVNEGTVFFCTGLESQVFVTGTVNNGSGIAARLALGWGDRNRYVSFLWEVRDTSNDRRWQNTPLPDAFLMGGGIAPLFFSENCCLSAGTRLVTSITPTQLGAKGAFDGDIFVGTLSLIEIQFSYLGFSIPANAMGV